MDQSGHSNSDPEQTLIGLQQLPKCICLRRLKFNLFAIVYLLEAVFFFSSSITSVRFALTMCFIIEPKYERTESDWPH